MFGQTPQMYAYTERPLIRFDLARIHFYLFYYLVHFDRHDGFSTAINCIKDKTSLSSKWQKSLSANRAELANGIGVL